MHDHIICTTRQSYHNPVLTLVFGVFIQKKSCLKLHIHAVNQSISACSFSAVTILSKTHLYQHNRQSLASFITAVYL